MTDQEKLDALIAELSNHVEPKRALAREIYAQMVALKDPSTKQLEPLEAAMSRRERLVKLGSQNLGKQR